MNKVYSVNSNNYKEIFGEVLYLFKGVVVMLMCYLCEVVSVGSGFVVFVVGDGVKCFVIGVKVLVVEGDVYVVVVCVVDFEMDVLIELEELFVIYLVDGDVILWSVLIILFFEYVGFY